MSESGWETVKARKPIRPTILKQSFTNEKFDDQLPVLSINFASNIESNKENRKRTKAESQIPIKIENNRNKPVSIKTPAKVPMKLKFKDLKTAFYSLDAVDLDSKLTMISFNYRDNDLMLLKSIAAYLNENVRFEKPEDALFFIHYLEIPMIESMNHPMDKLPPKFLQTITEIITRTKKESLQYFFDQSLSNLAECLNKDQPFVGHLLMIQILALDDPQRCVANLARNSLLRNSYQNQSFIGLSLIWALGQGGFADTSIGLKVFQDIMMPVADLKHYTRFVFHFVFILLIYPVDCSPISIQEFAVYFNSLSSTKTKPKDPKDLLSTIKPNALLALIQKYSGGAVKRSDLFMFLLKNLENIPNIERALPNITKCLFDAELTECLQVWKKNFKKNQNESLVILKYIRATNVPIAWKREFETFIQELNVIEFLEANADDDLDLDELKNVLNDLQNKMPAKNQKKNKASKTGSSSSGCCKFMIIGFLLFSAFAGFLAYDTHQHNGNFEATTVGQALKSAGALPHVENAWMVSMKYSARGYKWAEEHLPIYYGQTCTFLTPYCEFFKDFAITAVNQIRKGWANGKLLVEEKTPVVVDFVDQYIPGLGKKTHEFFSAASKTLCSMTCGFYSSSMDFFKTKVFVGQFSPESFGKALNTTQQAAAQYYSWFYEKVDFYSKVK